LDELARLDLAARHDSREVVSDPDGRYYGIHVSERALIPDSNAQLGETRFKVWLAQSAAQTSGQQSQSKTVAVAT
jgi:hypothetical protein